MTSLDDCQHTPPPILTNWSIYINFKAQFCSSILIKTYLLLVAKSKNLEQLNGQMVQATTCTYYWSYLVVGGGEQLDRPNQRSLSIGGSITVLLVSSLTWLDLTKQHNMLLFVCSETFESKLVNLETSRQWYFPLVGCSLHKLMVLILVSNYLHIYIWKENCV